MRGDISALKSAKKIRQNRLTHLCVAMVNHLGNSSSHQKCKNKNAFQWDAYHPLVDYIPAFTRQGGCVYPSIHCSGWVYPSRHWAVGVSVRGCLPEGVWQTPPGPKADTPAPCWQTDTYENITFRRSVIKFRSRWVLQLPDIIGKKTRAIFWRHYIYCTHRRKSSITANSKYCNIQWKSHKITISQVKKFSD